MAFYRPIASQGFRFSGAYTEILPCMALRPYIHSFWGTTGTQTGVCANSLVIPDTCMDLIFDINYTENRITGRFCALDDAAYYTTSHCSGDRYAVLGIRFFAWSAGCFTQDSLKDSASRVYHPEALFPKLCREIVPRLFELDTLERRAGFAETVLQRNMRPERICPDILNALDAMIAGRGTARIRSVAESVCMSERQMERLMRGALGMSPKRMTQLIRHQMIYRELLEGKFCAADAVERYGYADQSHLIRDFRRFHILSPAETIAGMGR